METSRVVRSLGALAHQHRLAIYRILVEQGPAGLPAGTIGERVGLLPSSLTFHLQALHQTGLIRMVRASRQLIYSADFTVMNELVGYLTENCCVVNGGACTAVCKPATASKRSRRRKAA